MIFLSEEIAELIKAQEYQEESEKVELSLFKLKNEKYAVVYKLYDLTNDESGITLAKEFDLLGEAQKEFDFFEAKE